MSIRYKIEILKPQLNDYVYAGIVHVNPENGEQTPVYSKVLETNVNGKMVVEGSQKTPWIVDIKHITPIPINDEILKKIGFEYSYILRACWFIETQIGTIQLIQDIISGYRIEIDGTRIPIPAVEYVHELQQLLRVFHTEIEIEL